jgi:DNA-binding Xre family transcriptional regulator
MESKIKSIAQDQGYKTPEALSKKLDIARTTVMNIWTGDVSKRQFSTMYEVAKLLGVAMEDLVSNERIE